MRYVLTAFVLVSGATIPIQVAANKRLYEVVRSPTLAVCLALAVGSTAVLAVTLLVPPARGEPAARRAGPRWAWVGGLLAAFAITVQIINAKQHGAGPIIALVVAGQLASAMLVDHFSESGWSGNQSGGGRWSASCWWPAGPRCYGSRESDAASPRAAPPHLSTGCSGR